DVEYAHSIGITGSRSLFVHTVWLNPHEVTLLKQSNTSCVHCPAANSQLGYGIAPIAELLEAGVPVGLGTDGAGSYTYDMFEMMRIATYLQKQKHQSADVFTAEQALEMATIHGAKALNLENEIGSIEVGKKADIILIDFDKPHLLHEYRVVPKLVYSANGADVTTTIVNGKVLYEKGVLTTLNEKEILTDISKTMHEQLIAADDETRRLLKAPWPHNRAYWKL
ncbi:MAG: N-ethylammeline chlorohydrolase, partial [Spirochaetia bacterium]|nr:N-ethylammeline chlorohydrolase [Spirochaetia bacterium]